MKHRSRLEIVKDILLVASDEGGVIKTRISYGASVGWGRLNQYLEELLKVGLLEHDGESSYWVTDKGEKFLRVYEDYGRSRKRLEEQIGNLERERKALRNIAGL